MDSLAIRCFFNGQVLYGLLLRFIEALAQMKDDPMAKGTVKWFNDQKGYGFVQPDDGSKDVFVHISAVEGAGLRTLKECQKVSFEIVTDKRTGKTSAGNLTAE